MPASSVTLNEIKRFYEDIKNETSNFKNIKAEMLMNNPRKILVLRLILGLSQNEFEKLLGKNNKNITKYESGKIKKMQRNTANRYVDKIIIELKKTRISKDILLENYNKFNEESKGWFKIQKKSRISEFARKGAISSIRSRTMSVQEQEIRKMLENNNINFKINHPLNENNGIVADFYLPKKNIVIECKRIFSITRRNHREKVRNLAYQGYKTRFYLPKLKLIAFLETKLQINERDKKELIGPFDFIVTNLEELFKTMTNF
ncbi:MAG: hypothetical protein ISS48_00415 [Candidatus Aenigmarchaeota archaeon]|nr:hypothetical protein [Candidatus Aenigmarchaeota archaeon]